MSLNKEEVASDFIIFNPSLSKKDDKKDQLSLWDNGIRRDAN